ncbi:MAG: hypothetical protein WC756_14530 [Taibaiella sp.]
MSSNLEHPPVSVPDAIEMTTNWREYYGQITGTNPADAFRGFKIPLEDLQSIIDLATQDPTINAARAYLALGEPAANNIIDPNTIHILLVPVADTTPTGADILEVTRAGKKVSTIMDFTSPCPAVCDFASPLYGLPTKK